MWHNTTPQMMPLMWMISFMMVIFSLLFISLSSFSSPLLTKKNYFNFKNYSWKW